MREPFNAAVGAGDGGSDGLLDFVCQRRRHFSQRAYPIDVCQIVLELTQSLAFLFCTFAIFNVREGSVPFNNLSMLVPKWDTTRAMLRPTCAETDFTAKWRIVVS